MKYYSHLQIQALRALLIQPIHISTLEKFNEVTICSLFFNELIEQRVKWIGPTEKGFELIDTFRRHEIRKRAKIGPLSKSIKQYVKKYINKTNLLKMKVA